MWRIPGTRRDTMKTPTHPAHRVLAPSSYRRMPWKNGGGRTTEVFVAPSGAALDAFAWRVSVADVDASGPFSAYPGIDRVLVLVSGNGMRLMGVGGRFDVTQPFEPVRFAGDRPLDCVLESGPVRDFNLLVRRGAARGDVRVVRNAGDLLPPADAYLCYAARGAFECIVACGAPIALAEDHALLIEPDGDGPVVPLALNPRDPGAVALVAVIGAS